MKRILLTGASGFLGSSLALSLLEAGYHISLLLRQSSRLDRLKSHESEFNLYQYRTYEEITGLVSNLKPDAVIHTACNYGRNGESNLQILDANVRFGLSILQGMLLTNKNATFINTGTVLSPDVNAYALSKIQFEKWGRALATSSSVLRFLNIRLQHMYGPGDNPSKFTTHVLHACQRNEPELYLTLGEQKRDFIYIDDVVSAYSTILSNIDKFEPVSDVDVGSGTAPSIKCFVETAHALTASRTKLLFGAVPYRNNEEMHSQADTAKLTELGWKPAHDLTAGLQKTIEMEIFK